MRSVPETTVAGRIALADAIGEVQRRRLTYLSPRKLAALAAAVRAVEASASPGVLIEAGCALGGSTALLALAKARTRPLKVYDVFGRIPPPTADDPPEVHARWDVIRSGRSRGIGGDGYYGYRDDLYGLVLDHLAGFGIDVAGERIDLVPGRLEDTLWIGEPVAFAHVDVDWYAPVRTCLERIFPALVVGGAIVLDDYHDWGGCRKAADEFLAGVAGRVALDDAAGSLAITRIG